MAYFVRNPSAHTHSIADKFFLSDFPKFDGSHLREWLNKCEEIFYLNDIPLESHVKLATDHLVGRAWLWFSNYMHTRYGSPPFWSEFIVDISSKFDVEEFAEVIVDKVYDEIPRRINNNENDFFNSALIEGNVFDEIFERAAMVSPNQGDLMLKIDLADVNCDMNMVVTDISMVPDETECDDDQFVEREISSGDGCQVFDEMPRSEAVLLDDDQLARKEGVDTVAFSLFDEMLEFTNGPRYQLVVNLPEFVDYVISLCENVVPSLSEVVKMGDNLVFDPGKRFRRIVIELQGKLGGCSQNGDGYVAVRGVQFPLNSHSFLFGYRSKVRLTSNHAWMVFVFDRGKIFVGQNHHAAQACFQSDHKAAFYCAQFMPSDIITKCRSLFNLGGSGDCFSSCLFCHLEIFMQVLDSAPTASNSNLTNEFDGNCISEIFVVYGELRRQRPFGVDLDFVICAYGDRPPTFIPSSRNGLLSDPHISFTDVAHVLISTIIYVFVQEAGHFAAASKSLQRMIGKRIEWNPPWRKHGIAQLPSILIPELRASFATTNYDVLGSKLPTELCIVIGSRQGWLGVWLLVIQHKVDGANSNKPSFHGDKEYG